MGCSSTVIRPKSIATVVVVLLGTAAVSSTPTDSAVMSCSVVSGGISDTDATKAVLPAPNPPATRTLSGMSCWPACGGDPRDSPRTAPGQEPAKDRPPGRPPGWPGSATAPRGPGRRRVAAPAGPAGWPAGGAAPAPGAPGARGG